MTRSALFAAVAAVCVSTTVCAQATEQPAQQAVSPVEAFREAVTPFIGTWEITAKQNADEAAEGRIVYSWDLTGDILLAHAQLKESDGLWQSLGLTVLAPGDTTNEIATHTFFTGGGVQVGTTTVGESERGNLLLSSNWADENTQMRLQIELINDSTMVERTWVRPNDAEAAWEDMPDTYWERVADEPKERTIGQIPQQVAVEAFREVVGPFIGTWEIEATWAWGEALEARNVYAWDLSEGLVLAHTQARDGDGPWYNRYLTVFAPGENEGELVTHTFVYDGTTRVGTMTVGESEDGNLMLSTSWTMGGAQVRQENELVDENTMAWRVWMRQNDQMPWGQVMDDEWSRVMTDDTTSGAELAAPDAAEESDRSIVRTATVNATPAEVWRAWTTNEGMTEWWVEEADIELKIGGKFELYMLPATEDNAGSRGSERCTILAYAKERMLAATWNAPPTFADQRFKHTRITLLFEPVENGEQTKVTLIHSGWPKDGMADKTSKWPQVYQYFESAWTFVFDRMATHFSE